MKEKSLILQANSQPPKVTFSTSFVPTPQIFRLLRGYRPGPQSCLSPQAVSQEGGYLRVKGSGTWNSHDSFPAFSTHFLAEPDVSNTDITTAFPFYR